jgi:hypothetical protein
MNILYSFISGGSDWTGSYSSTGTTSGNHPGALLGSVCQPGDILFLNTGYLEATAKSTSIKVYPVDYSEWNVSLKKKWFEFFLKAHNIILQQTDSLFLSLYSSFDTNHYNGDNPYKALSNPSVAYINEDNTEIVIGLNSYKNPFLSWCQSNNIPSSESIIFSHVAKVEWNNFVDYVWSFNGYEYPNYNFSTGGTLLEGGGNIFTEIRLGGDAIQASYIIKKNVDPEDPSGGICSGESGPFCIGDVLTVIDTSVRTSFGTNGYWSWWGGDNFTNNWHIADVKDPCKDYANVPAHEMLFPFKIISECKFEDFD